MKTTTKFLLIIMISMLSIQSYAQSFGVKGGLSLANMLVEDEDETYSDEFSMKPGFHIGGVFDYSLSDFLSIETGLLLNNKGFKLEEDDYTMKYNLFYLDIPITLKASYDLSDNLAMYGDIGPYLGLGLSGKVKGEYDGETDETDIEWGNNEDEDDLKRFEFGATFGGGVEIGAIQVGISYDLGLANISSYTDYGVAFKNRVLKFSVGYIFGK